MSTLYEVSSLITLVMNKPNMFAQVLGVLNKGTQIDVISISGAWAYFKYNNVNAYVKKGNLKILDSELIQVKGSITLKYLDSSTNNEIYSSETINNLELGSYSYEAKIIYGYKLQNDSTQSVNLTTESPNQVITFYYNQVLGSITIKYLDISTNTDIYESKIIENLTLGTYTYGSIHISGYVLSDNETKTVTITESSPNATITFKYTEILGTVTVKYIDSSSLNEIDSSTVISNLSLGTYSYTAKSFEGYEVVGNSTQSVTLNDSNLNPIISFNYSRISGNITIEYLDSSTLSEIAPSTTISNIALGSYTYDAIYIDNYEIDGDSIISITLTTTEPNKTISFKYNKIEIPDDLNWNEVPYISTYYIKPIVKPGEEVFIDYYITDYYYKEYMEKYNLKNDEWGDDNWTEEVWNNETFTVTVRVEGQDDKLYHYLKAGDHQVSLGSFSTEGEQKFSILCTDKYGRNSHELFNFFLVQDDIKIKVYIMTEDDLVTYNIKNIDDYEVKKIIDLSSLTTKNSSTVKAALIKATKNIIPTSKTYVCVIADTNGDGIPDNWWSENQVVYAIDYDKDDVLQESTNTRKGLQQLLDDKKTAGYNKLKLLPGTYRIDHQQQIYIPTQFTLDMNGSILKQNQFTGNKSLMIDLNNTFNSHVINGVIEGDYFSHDYTNSTNNSEWVNGISIDGESKYSSFENLTIKNITGYGSSNGIADSRDGKLGYTYTSPKSIGNTFKIGDVSRNTGLDITSTTRTTSDYIDISSYSNIAYLSVSVYLGYQGNPCGTWNLICHFYDENKNFIISIDSYQYRRITVPKNSKYMRVTILNTSYPTNLSIQYFRVPTHCSFKSIKHENCRCVGMAPAAMKDMLIESCEFINCGQSSAKCAFDAEDGWDMMQDVTFKNLLFKFNPNNYFLTCAGHNFIIDGQNDGSIYIWARTRSLVVINCKNVYITLQEGGKNTIVRHGVYRVSKNRFTGGTVANNLSKNNTSTSGLGGIVFNSTLCTLSNGKDYVEKNSLYKDCTIIISNYLLGYMFSIKMINCTFIPENNFNDRYQLSFDGGHLDNYYFEDCTFYGKSKLANHNGFYSANFIDCNFDDVIICPNVNANYDDIILFKNCNINCPSSNLIYYSPYSYVEGTFSNTIFNNCTINNSGNTSKIFIYAYAKVNGNCKFNDCIITLDENTTILDCYQTYLNYFKNYTIEFNNSPLPSNIKLLSDILTNNSNITIIIN